MFNRKGPILLGLLTHGFSFTPETELIVELCFPNECTAFQLKAAVLTQAVVHWIFPASSPWLFPFILHSLYLKGGRSEKMIIENPE